MQNRELQIMRIVRHPNIVELKAFYYSNGERVSFFPPRPTPSRVNLLDSSNGRRVEGWSIS